jgi:GMP synthase-like glutamine amidotransferase
MSWECPHQNDDALCDRLKSACAPFAKGCVLYGQRQMLGEEQAKPPLRVHVLQHVPFEGLGSIEAWLSARKNARVTTTRFFEGAALPPRVDANLVIALGGPMSVNDEAQHPWLREEKRFLAEAVEDGTPVLGICLGAQLIASALGARVYPNPAKEIGWFPVFAEPATRPDAFAFPAAARVFHWHGETFDLPPSAVHLAHSAACRHQAFQVGPCAIGLQFHLETTPANVGALLAHCADEVVPQAFVQSEADLRSAGDADYAAINALMSKVLDYLVGG